MLCRGQSAVPTEPHGLAPLQLSTLKEAIINRGDEKHEAVRFEARKSKISILESSKFHDKDSLVIQITAQPNVLARLRQESPQATFP